VIAAHRQLGQQLDVLGVALNQLVAGIAVVRAFDRPVLAVVVDPDDLIAGLEKLRDEVSANESGGARNEDLQGVGLFTAGLDL
jgi:hypothetical protein